MKTSFIRKGAAKQALQEPGTRPGLHGQTLISTGLAGLDSLLGGGQPLGTVLLILSESHRSPQCTSLLKYYLAEGVACGQALCLASSHVLPGEAPAFVPAQQRSSRSSTAQSAAEKEEAEEPELRIAWQYRRYIKSKAAAAAKQSEQSSGSQQKSRRPLSSSRSSSTSSTTPEWCHKFDLGKPLGVEALQKSGSTVAEISCAGPRAVSNLKSGVASFIGTVQEAGIAGGTRAPLSVGRIAIEGLGTPARQTDLDGLPGGGTESSEFMTVARTLHWLRGAVRDTRCAAVVTLSLASLPLHCQEQVPHLADGLLSVQALHDDSLLVGLSPDPTTAVGLVRMLRSPSAVGALGSVPLGAEGVLRLLRYKRRRLILEPIDIDPDAEQALADASSASGSSTSSMLCASPATIDGAGKLDF